VAEAISDARHPWLTPSRWRWRWSEAAWILAALFLDGVLGFLDFATGPEMSFAAFYLVPISLAVWKVGLRAGLFLSVSSAAMWYFAAYWGGAAFSHPWIPYWNGVGGLIFFVLTVVLIWRTKRLNLSLQAQAASLAEQVLERKRAEGALAENQRIFRLITENVSDLIALLSLQGERLYASPSYQIMLGQERWQAADYFAHIDPADRPRVRAAFEEVVRSGINQRADYRVACPGRPVRYLESEWSVIRADAGEPRHVVAVSREITLRKKMEVLYANEKDLLELIAQGKPLQEVLRKLIQKLATWSDQMRCSILVCDETEHGVLHVASARASVPLHPETGTGPERSLADTTVLSALVEVAPGPDSAAEEAARYEAAALNDGFAATYSKPIVSTFGELLGRLSIYSRAGENQEALRLQLFEKIAHVTAIALERQRSEETLRRLSSMILNAQEAERRRVARELHDSVNQLLSSVAFRVESILTQVENDPAMNQEITKVRFLLKKAIHEVRRISENLRPSELDELGLLAAVRELCDDFRERTQLPVALETPGAQERFDSAIELALYRIVQEALANIEKHAQAGRIPE
jgi:PAS domain S-box-containing protein